MPRSKGGIARHAASFSTFKGEELRAASAAHQSGPKRRVTLAEVETNFVHGPTLARAP